MLMTNKVGITGMGIVSSIGDNVSTFCNSLKNGKSGIKQTTSIKEPKISVDIAAEIQNFSFSELLNRFQNLPDNTLVDAKRLGQRAPFTIRTSIISALEAWQNALLFSNKLMP